MAKQLQVKLKATTSEPVHVPGLGSFVPGEWTDVNEVHAERFKRVHGKTVKQATDLFETKTIDVKDPEPEPDKEEDK